MLPSSMLHFGKHLALKRLPVATPFANVFIDNAREIAKPLTKRGFQ
jgi:hypothetical protein